MSACMRKQSLVVVFRTTAQKLNIIVNISKTTGYHSETADNLVFADNFFAYAWQYLYKDSRSDVELSPLRNVLLCIIHISYFIPGFCAGNICLHILVMSFYFILSSHHLHFKNIQCFFMAMQLKILILYVILPFCCIYMYIYYYAK